MEYMDIIIMANINAYMGVYDILPERFDSTKKKHFHHFLSFIGSFMAFSNTFTIYCFYVTYTAAVKVPNAELYILISIFGN
jgi:hypothetical protein